MAALYPLVAPAELHRAADDLQDATRALCAAARAHSAARFALEEARARLLAAGVDGKNAEVRDAQLRLALAPEHEAAERASVALSDRRADLECARAAWDCLRYEIRLAEVSHAADRPF